MSTIYEIRRENLRTLTREHGTGAVAKAAGYPSSSYISQMAGPKPIRDVQEKNARKIERSLGLPEYWLDQKRDPYGNIELAGAKEKTPPPVDNPVSLPTVDPEQFAVCAAAVSNAMVAVGAKLPAKKFAAIVTMLLDHADQNEAALYAKAESLVRIAV